MRIKHLTPYRIIEITRQQVPIVLILFKLNGNSLTTKK